MSEIMCALFFYNVDSLETTSYCSYFNIGMLH